MQKLPQKFHFLGVCGTAMGAVATAMKRRGYQVTGADDHVYPPMSTFLQNEGIEIIQGYTPGTIPVDTDVVVIGNAMSRGNPLVEEVLEKKLMYLSLPETMKEIFLRGKRNFVVSGTHGKTTTSSMLAWLLENAGKNPSFMIGGLAQNLGRGGRFTDSEFTVLEGDEYDTAFFDKRSKFLHYLPEVAVINNIEFDHADIFNNVEEIILSFQRMLRLVPRNGMVFVNGDDANALKAIEGAHCPVTKVGFGQNCDVVIKGVEYAPETSSFDWNGGKISVPMVGEFNVRNAVMACCAAQFAGLSDEQLREGMKNFKGVARRQQMRGEAKGICVFDDFAHHPTAIANAIAGFRQKFPNQRLWVIFEPRSNTTQRNVFQNELAEALSHADISIVARLENPKKVKKEEQLNIDLLVSTICSLGKESKVGENVEEIVQYVAKEARFGDIIAVMSNGGFGGIHAKLLEKISQ